MYVKDFNDFLTDMNKVDESILMSREERHNRAEIYDDIVANHLPRTVDFLRRLRSAEALIEEDIQNERQIIEEEQRRHAEIVTGLQNNTNSAKRESRLNRRYFYVSLAFNVILLILGALAIPSLIRDLSAPPAANSLSTPAAPGAQVQPPPP
jgi:hypothetical protein